MLLNIDLAALKVLSDERATAGFYQAGLVLSNAPYYLVASAMLPVLFVQLARQENLPATTKTVGETLGLILALVIPFELALMVFPGHALTTFFPDAYVQGADTLRLLAVGNVFLILAATLVTVLDAVFEPCHTQAKVCTRPRPAIDNYLRQQVLRQIKESILCDGPSHWNRRLFPNIDIDIHLSNDA